MLVSYKWLQDYVDLDGVTPEELADRITNAGIEVEHLTYPGKDLKGIVVGKVSACEPHPASDHLHLCQVDLGAETVQIVCGAQNVAAGQKVPVATVGARIGGGVQIRRSKFRGEESNGMICALSELGVDSDLVPKEYADGIYVFDEDVPVGADALPYLNLDDAILDLDILVSSAHCMNMIGVAHEVAAIFDRPVHIPAPDVIETDQAAADKISLKVEAGEKVPYYSARLIEGIEVASSPRWMQLRLMAAGIRPISNVVDISNYVMLEYGQPLHTFDFDAFGSDRVLVRFADRNETIKTLDGQERTLTKEDIVITNGKEAAAVAGIMGGESSEVTLSTNKVLLESAVFDPISIRKTAARLQMRTDASSRFEKRLDRNRVAPASDRAAELLAIYAHARVLKGIVEQGERTVPETVITMPWKKINQVLGANLSFDVIKGTLGRLGFTVKTEGDTIHVKVPARRFDVAIPEDLVEEVGRMYGYDHIPATLPEGSAVQAELTPYQKLRRRTERLMESAGLTQAYTYSLTTGDHASAYTVHPASEKQVKVIWPMSEEHAVLRQSIVPQLIGVVKYHLNRQMPDVALYEIGKVFIPKPGNPRPGEEEHLAGAITGRSAERSWEGEARPVDFYTVKGVLETLFESLAVSERIDYRPARRDGLHPGQTAEIFLDGKVIGYAGALHPKVQKDAGLNETFVFEVAIESLLRKSEPEIAYRILPRFPSITRDIALVVDRSVSAADLDRVIREAAGPLLASVRLFDVYEGAHVAENEKSMAFSLVYLDPERTLTDDEVNAVHGQIIDACSQRLGAQLRS
ncbi:phenylalanine--tRNA ligase subunit beta [Sporolactobacillus putidus]|uniref:Phenylalanine--tRNA ligase beta subunit n=1 Tax=Sporolactobacillus putidus TaxID=492735 RepID=A0A917VZ66_9BACL|nr:phenylalanine--tRNA ligase subunit beta [Sporolactobacillus putidus]GGL41852.1 phenylalanine--tRNA ligase beta subunit [Sporolactobacillus putidus]